MQTRAPDEGPSSGGHSASAVNEGGQSAAPNAAVEERLDPKALRAIAKKYAIDSTKSLVAAYNAATGDERAVLLGWINKYDERSDECLKPKTVLEYAELANVASHSANDDDILKSMMHALCSRICQGNFHKPNFAVALCRALKLANPSAWGGVGQLVFVATKLLSSLSPQPKITRKNFAACEATFLALQQAFFLLHEINHKDIVEKEKNELRRSIEEKERAMELSCSYYPVSFHFKTLRQAVERLETKDAPSDLERAAQQIGCGLCGFLYVFHCVRNLARCDINPAAIQDAYAKIQTAIANMGVSKRPWFDTFKNLMTARQEASEDETKLGLFETNLSAAMEHQEKTKDKEDLKALRYGIVRELGTLALEGLSEKARDAATAKLVDLVSQQAVNEGWVDDSDILIALLDVMHELHGAGRCNEDIKNALLDIQRSYKGPAQRALAEWLGGSSIEVKLAARSPQKPIVEHKDLCIDVGRDVGYIPLAIMNSKGEELKKRYLHDDFATVSSLFGEKRSSKHVKDMKHHVVISEEITEERKNKSNEGTKEVIQGEEDTYRKSSNHRTDQAKEHYEKKRRVAKPIGLDDLFKRRSLKPGDPESEVRRVLLYGNPGSGKTCITKVFAHKWALGEMAQEFETVYVVPVRVLNGTDSKRHQWTSLEEAISRICFSKRKRALKYEDLVLQIEDALDDHSTLLVVDGLDEANDNARELVSTTWERSCKILFLSRPYNMRNVETRVDIQVECLGFDDEQLRDYIRSELSKDEASRLIRSLEKTTAMWEMAHIPVTAHIICCLSKEHGTSVEEEKKRASTFQIYNDMANYVWKRFEEKQAARNVQKVEIFKDLEKIAFESLRNGQILIQERFVMQNATSKKAARTFKESGLLLLVLEGQEYQFPHLTFQEYFAGRYIARILKQSRSDEKTRVLDLIRKGKYDEKHKLTLTFAMHAFAERRSKQALEEMLSIMDEQPVEVLGIQHLILKMRVLEAILEETDEEDLEDVLDDERAIKLVESARHLLECTVDDILIREILVKEFRQLSRVLEKFPQILDDTVNKVKKLLAYSKKLTWMEMTKTTEALMFARHSSKHSSEIQKFLVQKIREPEGWCSMRECIRRLSFIAEQMPQLVVDHLTTLARAYADGDEDVRQAAIEAIDRVVAATPQHAGKHFLMLSRMCVYNDWRVRRAAFKAIDRAVAAATSPAVQYLSTLARGCADEDEDVRSVAMKAISRVVAAAPQNAGQHLSSLAMGGSDKDWRVRRAALEVIGRVIVEEPLHAGKHLVTLVSACADGDWQVRRASLDVIGRVVTVTPLHVVEHLATLERACADGDVNVRQAALEAIRRVVAAAPQHAGKHLSSLARGGADEDWRVRQLAMEAIGGVVAAEPKYAAEHLSTLTRGSVDEVWPVRLAALEAIGRVVVEEPLHVCEHLATLARGCTDEDWHVRQAALEAIGRVVTKEPLHAGEHLATLASGCAEEDWRVRRASLEVIGRVIAAAPQHAGEHLSTLARGCADEDRRVCRVSLEAIDGVVAKEPLHAGKHLSTLARGCDDEDWRVRRVSVEIIGRVVAAMPEHVCEHLATLARGCTDEDWHVRQAALEAIDCVVTKEPRHGGEHLLMLSRACVDKDCRVRRAALEVIGHIVTAAPQNAGEHLATLARACVDENRRVRRAAFDTIDLAVAAATSPAVQYLSTLARGCADEDEDVRSVAMKAIGRVVAAAPQNAGQHLSSLAKGGADKNWRVRRASLAVIGRVVAATPQHAGKHLSSLARGGADEDWRVRRAALDAIGRVVVAAPQNAGEYLLALVRGCTDDEVDVRQAALEAIGCVIAAAPEHAGKHFSSLARGGADEDWRVRRAALEAIGRVVMAAPQHAGKLLLTLARGCADEDWRVRRAAIKATSRIVTAAPQHAGKHLLTLARGCADEDWRVRRAAIKATSRIVTAAPQHAGKHLSSLTRGCADENEVVRQVAMKAFARVVAVAPQYVRMIMSPLTKGCVDENEVVRREAMKAIDRVVADTPQLAGELLPSLATGCGYEDVRREAIEVIDRVVAAAHWHACEFLSTLAKGCADEDEDVRDAARTSLKNVKLKETISSAISFPSANKGGLLLFFVQNAFTLGPLTKFKPVPLLLHTSFSQEIGKWKKEAIDVFVGYLRQECDEEFPGLLENICIGE